MFRLNAAASASPTTYTLPQEVHWIRDTEKGIARGNYYAVLRGKYEDKCDNIIRNKFPDGFVFP
jgi:hypothetical protein